MSTNTRSSRAWISNISRSSCFSEIDKSITHLQKTKEALILSKKHLLSADSKSQDLTVKKLTRNNPTMKKKFNDLNNFEDEVA